MALNRKWHESDDFWQKLAPFIFSEDRWANTPGEVDQLLELIQAKPGSKLLDIGCGPGRFSLELARRGYSVTGIDRTEAFLTIARKAAEEEDLNATFIYADMRKFVEPEMFDGALSMYTSFGYFYEQSENQKVLENAFLSLRSGGVFLIEVMGKEVLARVFTEKSWDQNNQAYLLQERRVTTDWTKVENRWILIDGQEQTEFEVNHWIYSAVELGQMLENAGFCNIMTFGSLAGTPYDHEARRLVLVAHKL